MQQIIQDIKEGLKKLEVLLDENKTDKELAERIDKCAEKMGIGKFDFNNTISLNINDYDRIELNWGYREGISIMREGDKIHIDRERCVPNGPDDIDSDFEELLTINI